MVRAAGLTRSYRRAQGSTVAALRGIDLTVDAGEMLAVVGPSGGGKSTLLNLIGGLDRPDSGSLEVAGTDLMASSQADLDRFRRHHVGFVFQFFNLLEAADARDNVAFALLARGLAWADARMAATDLLGSVGLADRADHRPSEMSGGEQQRVAIARAIAGDPDLLIADEPTGDVDGPTTDTLMDLLCGLNHDLGITVIVATHDLSVAGRADRICEVRDGSIAER
ncbi:ABC transporter ATP-binding protein [bacterium]|nr:ABC transporter ATP-binding protein [bacterium]